MREIREKAEKDQEKSKEQEPQTEKFNPLFNKTTNASGKADHPLVSLRFFFFKMLFFLNAFF